MAYNETVAHEIRTRIDDHPGFSERRMFGGIAFMVNGNMALGVHSDDLMVRIGDDAHDEAITLPGVRIFDLSARPMRGWVLVAPEGYSTETDLNAWIKRGVAFAESLAPK